MLPESVHELIRMALSEDLGGGDITGICFIPEHREASATIRAKETGIVAGLEVAREVFRTLDHRITARPAVEDGTKVQRGDVVMHIHGPARTVLSGERTALNFLQRLSGVATQTQQYVQALAPYPHVKILDTRKTTPGWRWLEKMAVRTGGGTNHRTGLYDMVMVKDNHLSTAGDLKAIQDGINRARALRSGIRIELEADSIAQVRSFITLTGVNVIMLDNMSLADMQACVALCQGSGVQLEASGNVTLARLPEIAATGVDFISSGALTHSVKALDLSLDFAGTAL